MNRVCVVGAGVLGALAACIPGGCAGDGRATPPETASGAVGVGAPKPRLAPILHTVFVRLRDPLDTAEFADACLAMADEIPSVSSAFAGIHLETGRESVVADYDVCFTVGFQTPEAVTQYLDHPAHQRALAQWGSRIEWIKIHDARDARP